MERRNQEDSGFHVRILDNGVHELHWTSPDRSAVDAWLSYNDSLYATTDRHETLCFLHVFDSAKFPPISYIVLKVRALQEKYPLHPPTRSAVLFTSRFFGGFVNILSTMLNRQGKDVTRFFDEDQRERAIRWLLQEDDG